MFGEECTLLMDVSLAPWESELPDLITSPYAVWVRDALEVAYDQVCRHSGHAVQRQKRLRDGYLPWGIGFCVITPRQRNANLTLRGLVCIWSCPWQDVLLGFSGI